MMTARVRGHLGAVMLAIAGICSLSGLALGVQQPPLLEANNPVSVPVQLSVPEAEVAQATALPVAKIEQLPLGHPQKSRALGIASGADGDTPAVDSYDPTQNEVVRVLLALGGVLALILLLRAVLRRMGAASGVGSLGGRRPSGVLEVLGRFPTGRKQSMVLLKLGRRIVLVHQTPMGMQSLAEVVDPDEVASLLTRVEAGHGVRGGKKPGAALKRIFSAKRSNTSGDQFSSVLKEMQDDPWDAVEAANSGDVVASGQDVQSVLSRAPRRETGVDGSELVDLTRAAKINLKKGGSAGSSRGGEARR
ncbi:MAG: flagellar biosynthetic protein FliO [Phycisphaerales bacterium]|nr:flagellar biosynthetic protein FliO [Phycisphaerales bacterium]